MVVAILMLTIVHQYKVVSIQKNHTDAEQVTVLQVNLNVFHYMVQDLRMMTHASLNLTEDVRMEFVDLNSSMQLLNNT
jgi:hypothetical protein